MESKRRTADFAVQSSSTDSGLQDWQPIYQWQARVDDCPKALDYSLNYRTLGYRDTLRRHTPSFYMLMTLRDPHIFSDIPSGNLQHKSRMETPRHQCLNHFLRFQNEEDF